MIPADAPYQGIFLKSILTAFFLLIFIWPVHGQKLNAPYQLNIKKAPSPIIIDGILDEKAWQEAEVATDFHMVSPMDTSHALLRTDVRMTYDDEYLYIIAVCYRSGSGPNVVQSLRRDFSFGRNDNFLVFIDPFDDQMNGFSFGANAAGAQWDGLMYNGGSVNLSWDNKWLSKVKNYDDKWIFEAAIPFKSLRYNDDITKWGINFSRFDVTSTERSSWAPVPRQFPTAALAYTGSLIWDTPPPSTGTNISLIPYTLGGYSRDFQFSDSHTYRGDIGLDAKIGVSSSLNLDLTINPDFSQVEVDEQVIDLDRYELFFPERRQFFLENEDIFANFGNQNIRPFFSRRIGLESPIDFGARMSGQINRDWRMGIMNMQTRGVDQPHHPSQNFSVISLKRRVSSRSNIGMIFVNKQSLSLETDPETDDSEYSAFDRNAGIEYNLASSNDLWNGNVMLLNSFSPGISGRTASHAASMRYSDGNWNINWAHEYVGRDYSAEVGFVPRRGYIRFNPQISYLHFPGGSRVLNHGPSIIASNYFDESFQITDYEIRMTYNVNFRSGSSVKGWIFNTFAELLNPFDPTNISGFTLDPGTRHDWKSYGAAYSSKAQSLFTYNISMQYGGFYAEGTRFYFASELGYRFQPYVNVAINTSYNRLQLPELWGRSDFWLTGTRLDITFTNNLYLTTFTQYNEQLENVNINTRFQWRFQPASDLFIVYTDNYLPNSFSVKNRALVFKFTYWWNV